MQVRIAAAYALANGAASAKQRLDERQAARQPAQRAAAAKAASAERDLQPPGLPAEVTSLEHAAVDSAPGDASQGVAASSWLSEGTPVAPGEEAVAAQHSGSSPQRQLATPPQTPRLYPVKGQLPTGGASPAQAGPEESPDRGPCSAADEPANPSGNAGSRTTATSIASGASSPSDMQDAMGQSDNSGRAQPGELRAAAVVSGLGLEAANVPSSKKAADNEKLSVERQGSLEEEEPVTHRSNSWLGWLGWNRGNGEAVDGGDHADDEEEDTVPRSIGGIQKGSKALQDAERAGSGADTDRSTVSGSVENTPRPINSPGGPNKLYEL